MRMTYLAAKALVASGDNDAAWALAQLDEGLNPGVTRQQFIDFALGKIAEDATPEGMQLVIPGCEKIQAAGPAQMVLF